EVEVRAVRRLADDEAVPLVLVARDHDHVLGHGEHSRALRHLALLAVALHVSRIEQRLAGLRRADDDPARRRALALLRGLDEIERRRLTLLRDLLLRCEQIEDRRPWGR